MISLILQILVPIYYDSDIYKETRRNIRESGSVIKTINILFTQATAVLTT